MLAHPSFCHAASRSLGASLGLALVLSCLGCMSVPQISNPIFVRANDPEAVWERAVDVLHTYQFPIERENRLDGQIESQYKVGSGAFEPWHFDSVTTEDRLESTLQSIRRRATVSVSPVEGGYLVGFEVQKEIEDPQRLIVNAPGYATFRENTPLQRDLDIVVGPSTPEGWAPLGRDDNLERSMAGALMQSLTR